MKILFLGLVLAAASAFATTVTFDTNNPGDTTFSCGNYAGSGSCNFNALTPYVVQVDNLILTYSPNSGSVEVPPQSSIGAGDIVASCAIQGGCVGFADFTGVELTLFISTTGGVTGDAIFTSVLTGSASGTSSVIRVPLVPTSYTLTSGATSVTYTPDQPALGYTINPVSDGRATSIQMLVDSTTDNAVPEPSSMALLGGGLLGLGFIARRRASR